MLSNRVFLNKYTNGVFYADGFAPESKWGIDGYDGAFWDFFYFNASRCSPVYGRSLTVQPSATTVNYFIRAK